MSARKGNNRIRMAIVQFHYEHRKLEGRMEKIRKNAEEKRRKRYCNRNFNWSNRSRPSWRSGIFRMDTFFVRG